jgi:hypothetical protein
MEQVKVRTYRECDFPKRYGSDYVRADGTRTQIATGLVGERNAKLEAEKVLTECQWAEFDPERKDFIDVGTGWTDPPPTRPG